MNDNSSYMSQRVNSLSEFEREILNESFSKNSYIPMSEMLTPMNNYIEENPPIEVFESPEEDSIFFESSLNIESCPNMKKKQTLTSRKRLYKVNPIFSQESGIKKRSKLFKNVLNDITNIPKLDPYSSGCMKDNYTNSDIKTKLQYHYLLNESYSKSISNKIDIEKNSIKNESKNTDSEYFHVVINLQAVSFDPYSFFENNMNMVDCVFDNIDQRIKLLLNYQKYKFNQNINYARIKIIEWIFDFVYTYECSIESAFMAIQIIDHFLYFHSDYIPRSKYQLYAVSSLLIFSKLFDIKPVSINECVYTTCDQYTVDDILEAELILFQHSQLNFFNICFYNYIETFYTKFVFYLEKCDHTLFFLTLSEMVLMSPKILLTYNFLDISLSFICIAAKNNSKLSIKVFNTENIIVFRILNLKL